MVPIRGMVPWRRWRGPLLRILCCVAILHAGLLAWASEYHGQVFFDGLPVPGVTVTVTQGAKQLETVTDLQGLYEFADLPDGLWKIQIEMRGFSTLKGQVTVTPNMSQGTWELKLLGLDQMLAKTPVSQPPSPNVTQEKPKPETANAPQLQPPSDESTESDSNALLINGSVNNAATSKYSLSPAFGNRRPGSKRPVHGRNRCDCRQRGLRCTTLFVDRPGDSERFLQRGDDGLPRLGGPLNIPHLMWHGPDFFVAYQRTREGDAAIQSALVPTAAERSGDLSGLLNPQGQPVTIYDPATGLPLTGPIPVNPQAQALLNLYPLPDLDANSRYNYQTQVLNDTHLDALQSRLKKTIGRRDDVYGGFAFLSSRADTSNLFHFRDTTNILGMDAKANWSHTYLHQMLVVVGYHFTRLRTEVRPEFQDRENISGNAGIFGNNQDPTNWGPPQLDFSSGIASLSDANSEFNRNHARTICRCECFEHARATYRHVWRRLSPSGSLTNSPSRILAEHLRIYRRGDPGGGRLCNAAASDLGGFFAPAFPTPARRLAYGNADKVFSANRSMTPCT